MIQLLSGAIAGLAQFVVGQPLDYLKVKYQTSTNNGHNGLFYFCKQIYREGGLKGFYKGGSKVAPMLPFITGTQFMVYQVTNEGRIESGKAVFEAYQKSKSKERITKNPNLTDDGLVSLKVIAQSGCISGLFISLLVNHVEILKLLKQVDSKNLTYPQLLEKSMKASGGKYKTSTRAISLTIFRQSIGGAIYFYTYEYVLRKLSSERGISRKFAELPDFAISGAAAGVAPLLLTFPFDSIKSQYQSGVFKNLKKPTTFESLRANFRGFGVACLRGSLLGALTFSIYEQVRGTSLLVKYMSQF